MYSLAKLVGYDTIDRAARQGTLMVFIVFFLGGPYIDQSTTATLVETGVPLFLDKIVAYDILWKYCSLFSGLLIRDHG